MNELVHTPHGVTLPTHHAKRVAAEPSLILAEASQGSRGVNEASSLRVHQFRRYIGCRWAH